MPTPPLPHNDFLLVPRVRVGPVHARTSPQELRHLFPASKVVDQALTTVEGAPLVGTVVFPHTPNRLELIWKDRSRTRIESARVTEVGGKWRLAQTGIFVGMPLTELVRRNGGHPITFSGFGWELGGIVSSYGTGPLARPLDGTQTQIILGYDLAHQNRLSKQQQAEVINENSDIVSTNPNLRALQPFVQLISFDLT